MMIEMLYVCSFIESMCHFWGSAFIMSTLPHRLDAALIVVPLAKTFIGTDALSRYITLYITLILAV